MKKTFKKQLILFSVTVIMMILALIMPASAEGKVYSPCPDGANGIHSKENHEVVVYEPTCLQYGYTIEKCGYCNVEIIGAYHFTEPVGHEFEVSYVKDGDCYRRVRTCVNDGVCCRAGLDPVDATAKDMLDNYTETAKEEDGTESVYYAVEYRNEWASPEFDDPDRADSYYPGCYDANVYDTWVMNYNPDDPSKNLDAFKVKYYPADKKSTVDSEKASPDFEFVEKDGAICLFAKDGKEDNLYNGDLPVRGKDLKYGRYDFSGWALKNTENGVRTYVAEFSPVTNVTVVARFYDYNSFALTQTKTIPYADTVNYGNLVTPSRPHDQRYSYTFSGWALKKNETNEEYIYPIDSDIRLYCSTGIYANYKVSNNQYKLKFVNHYGNPIAIDENTTLADFDIICDESFVRHIIDSKVPDSAFDVPKDKEYLYKRNENAWIVKAVNGEKPNTVIEVNPNRFNLPANIIVTDAENKQSKMVNFGDGDVLTIAPKYDRYFANYSFKISIRPALFSEEDVYEKDNDLHSYLLDQFIIQVKDSSGNYIAGGQTDENGEFRFTTTYRPGLTITATTSNKKYYGDHYLDLASCRTHEEIVMLEKNGIVILPQVTEEWKEGLKGCSCICHSILSPIIIKIYNIVYSLFGKEFVCCDDLFIVHGKVLAYGNKY